MTGDETLAAIKQIYYRTTRQTIERDLARAVELLKTLESEEQRERAAVYMDGLSEMRSDWLRRERAGKRKVAR